MGGRTITMGSRTKVKENRGGRKKCPEGTKCPYKHEYQHDLEYTHEDLEVNEKSKKSRPNLPGSSGLFTGGGQRLGESVSLRNSFLPNSKNVSANSSNSGNNNNNNSSSSSSRSSSSSSSSSSGISSRSNKNKTQIQRKVIATAASAREASAQLIPSNNGAGGCGRDGSGIFVNQTQSSESKVFPQTVSNSSYGTSTKSCDSQSKSSSQAKSRLKDEYAIQILNDIDLSNMGSGHTAFNDRNNANGNFPNDEKTRKRMEVIHLDSDDDDDDEIVFLGHTDTNSNSSNNRSQYISDSIDQYSTGVSSHSSSSSSGRSSSNSDYTSGRRESYPEIINVNSRGHDTNSNSNINRNQYSSDSTDLYSTGVSINPSSSSSNSGGNSDRYSGRRESYPEIISTNSRGQVKRDLDLTSSSYSSNSAVNGSKSIYFDHKDSTSTRNNFNDGNNVRVISGNSNLTARNTSFSSSSPTLVDEMLKVVCEICSKKIHINSLDYHLRRHELAGDDVKHKQDKEYEKSVEEEVMRRTEKEEELRAAEKAKLKAQEDAEYSDIVKKSIEFEAKAETEYFRKNLPPEPGTSERLIRIRFCLPMPAEKGSAPVKLVRRFYPDRSFQDAIDFLKAQEALSGLKWTVRMSTGTEQFRISERRSFSELGILTDTSFLVVLLDSY